MDEQPDKKTLERQLAEERAERARAAAGDEPGDDDEQVDDDELEQDDETDDETDAEPAGDEPDDELLAEQLGELMAGFETGLRELFGIADALEPVPMDGMFGFMLPGTLDFKTNEKFRRCSTCNGQGAVLTGSLADGKQTANCPRCDGRGYLEKLADGVPAGVVDGVAVPVRLDPDAGFGVPKWMGDPAVGPH